MKFKAVIFDLDGTLLNTIDDIAGSMNHVLRLHGWPGHDTEEYKMLVGDGIDNLICRSLPGEFRRETMVSSCIREYRSYYADHWSDRTEIYGNITDLLDELEKRNVRKSVLSNKSDVFAKKMVLHYFPGREFDVIRGSIPGVPNKPDPASAIFIAEHIGISPSEIIYCGDSSTDMKTSTAAGMYPVGALWGFRGREELNRSGAAHVISSPLELLDLL